MEYRVLGSLEVVGAGGPIPLGGPKQRSVLAMLVLSANRIVSVDRLIDGVWGDDANARAAATLQTYISSLRNLLEPDRPRGGAATVVVARAPGYVLEVDPDSVDLLRFETLVAHGRTALQGGDMTGAAEILHRALALWRGAPLADLAAEPFAAGEIVRIDQARMGAIEERIDAELTLGRHRELIPELESLVSEYPLRERVWGQLIVALYRSERQADALSTYSRARSLLADELGIDPGPALREVERAILAQDLDVPAPVARTVAAPAPVRIPIPGHPIVGRDVELEQVCAGLVLHHHRLISLVGPGGIGKTRLSLEVAREVADSFPGGVYFVDLASVVDPDQVLPTIARAVGQADPGATNIEQTLVDLLADRHLLLVLDNLEQVLEAAAPLSRVLSQTPKVQVLATTRSALRIAGEHEYPLAGLDVSPPGGGTRGAAVELFESRALAIRPDLVLVGERLAAAQEICRRLEGSPLAVELAAARVRTLSVESILARLDDSLSLLTTGARDAPLRHRTLRAAIEWSTGLLTDAERRTLGRLGGFVGGFNRAAAVSVCGPETEDMIEVLVDCSLLRTSEVAGEPRFHLPEPVRQWAAAELGDPLTDDAYLDGLVSYFVDSTVRLAAAIDGPDAAAALASLEADQANLRAVTALAVRCDDVDSAARIVVALAPAWQALGRLTEGRARLAEVIADLAPGPRLAEAQVAAGRLAYQQTDIAAAVELLTAALAAPDLLDGETASMAQCILGATAVMTGDRDSGRAAAEAAMREAEVRGYYAPHVVALSVLAIAAAIGGDFVREKELYEQRLVLTRGRGDRIRVADTLTVLGEIAFDEGDYATASGLVREAFEIADTTSRSESRDALILLGRIAVADQDLDRANELLDEAMLRAVDVGQTLALALCVRVHAAAATLRGDWEGAARLFGGAQALRDTAMSADATVEADLAASELECRLRLGDDEFARQRQAGAELELAQIIEATLSR